MHGTDYIQLLCTLWIMQVRSICSWWKYELDEAKYNVYKVKFKYNLDDLLTVHRSTTLVDFQLNAQNSYLLIHNIFIKILYMFQALPCSSSGGVSRNHIYMQTLVLSLSAGDCPVHRLRKNFLNRCTRQLPAESDDTRGCIYTIMTYTSWRRAG